MLCSRYHDKFSLKMKNKRANSLSTSRLSLLWLSVPFLQITRGPISPLTVSLKFNKHQLVISSFRATVFTQYHMRGSVVVLNISAAVFRWNIIRAMLVFSTTAWSLGNIAFIDWWCHECYCENSFKLGSGSVCGKHRWAEWNIPLVLY